MAATRDWQTFDRPAIRRQFVRRENDGTEIAELLIQGVHCAACTWRIESTLRKLPGVVSIEVNPVTTRTELHWHPDQLQLPELLKRIADLGFTPVPFLGHGNQNTIEEARRLALRRLLVAGLGMMQVSSYAVAMYMGAFQGMDEQMEEFFRLISLLVATPIVLYSGAPFFAGAWRNIRTRTPGMDIPVALAIGSAWSASVWNTFAGTGEIYFDSATMFVFFLSGTRYLEAAGRYRALDLTHSLAQYLPATAVRVTATGSEEVGIMELVRGDHVLVAPGTGFPADGILLDGPAHVDESMLTGESMPVVKAQGDAVVAGTVNLNAATHIAVNKTGPDTVLAQIGRMVTQAGMEKPRFLQLTDRIASIIVIAIMVVATAAGMVWWIIEPTRVFEIVLTVLVVTCPCALAIATPAAFAFATGRLARDGFLIRRGAALPALATVSRVIFDKTGTLTVNALRITNTITRADCPPAHAKALAAALEAHSAHPIAHAFTGMTHSIRARNVRMVAGGGLEGIAGDELLRIGNREFVTAIATAGVAVDFSEPPILTGQRLIFLGNTAGLLARFEIAEDLRPGARELLDSLGHRGISSVIASGDQAEAVANLANSLGIRDWRARMLPEDKLQWLRDMQQNGQRIAAVGDGINDSPLLAGADVSIAMGSGTSMAHYSADCVWLGAQLNGLDKAFAMAQQTMRIVKQNMVWALGYNLLAVPLAVTGSIAPWMAALGMSLSSLLVMLNALRLSLPQGSAGKPALIAGTPRNAILAPDQNRDSGSDPTKLAA